MRRTDIKENAGKVWRALNEVHEASMEDIASKLNLSKTDTALSIGWLASENKVKFRTHSGKTLICNCETLNFVFG
jgi:predicted transcriptional regulator